MLRVDSWLDVAPLENMEEDQSFMFLKKNLMNIFFFFWTWPKKYKPKSKGFFFFWKMKICSLSKSEEDEDEDEDGVKEMKIYLWLFFWKTYPLNENNFGWKLMQIAG